MMINIIFKKLILYKNNKYLILENNLIYLLNNI